MTDGVGARGALLFCALPGAVTLATTLVLAVGYRHPLHTTPAEGRPAFPLWASATARG